MSYKSITEMASNQTLIARIAACAADEGLKDNPVHWAQQNVWRVCAAPDWDTAWDYAVEAYNVNQNPDTGARTDVITDAMILASVQPIIAEQQPA